MFQILNEINPNLYERYLTLERNIKAQTNSFYDSYLDLQEQFVKAVLLQQSFEIRVQDTCGAILRKPEVKAYFTQSLDVDEYTYNKMQDYTLKVNAHKHRGEKTIQIETVINYLRILYSVVCCHFEHQGVVCEDFNADYYISIFGIYEKENISLREQVQSLKEELSSIAEQGRMREGDFMTYQQLCSPIDSEMMSLEEQNAQLQKQISKLKDIKLSSLEDKLNRTIEMLLSLQAAVIENRAVSYAVGDSICGSEVFRSYIEKAKEHMQNV